MSLLQKSAPIMLFGSVVVAAFGAAALTVNLEASEQAPKTSTVCADKNASVLQQIGCAIPKSGINLHVR
jgi:hypothetical protein